MANIVILLHPKEFSALENEIELQNPSITFHSVVTMDLKAEPEQVKYKPQPKFVMMHSRTRDDITIGNGRFMDFVSSIPGAIAWLKEHYDGSLIGKQQTDSISDRMFFQYSDTALGYGYIYLIPIE